MADLKSFKIETPKNLDAIFSLDCFKYNEMKGLFKQIYEYLTRVGLKIGDMDARLNAIPNFDGLEKSIKDLEKRMADLAKRVRTNEDNILENKVELSTKIDNNFENLRTRDADLESRIAILEEEVEALKNRPVATGGGEVSIDYSKIATNEDMLKLIERMKLVEKRNIEQDERLTDNELRLEKLEKLISDPMERIIALETRCDNMQIDLNNKVSVSDLYNELLKKADINGLKALEASLLRLNDLINDLVNQFADKVENDKAHKLLQKNLKNLYDLFMSLKGDGTEDDPMFTAKGLFCASCTKGVQNMLGFRADHTAWQNFPFKDPGSRMQKMG